VRFDAQAGAKAENRARILGNVRLVERDSYGRRWGDSSVAMSCLEERLCDLSSQAWISNRGGPETDPLPDRAHNVTFRALASAKPVPTLVNGALRACACTARVPIERHRRAVLPFRAAATGPPRRLRTSVRAPAWADE
jgi:hypothetical protein